MTTNNVGLWLAFLAGFASFLSPCILALVPVYVGYLGGRASGETSSGRERWFTFLHGFAFVCGFTLVFIFFNIIAAGLGLLLSEYQTWIARVGGVVVIIFGVHLSGIYRFAFLDYERKFHRKGRPNGGFVSSFFLGVIFSAGWTPCVGPILAWILTYSMSGGSTAWAATLGAAYSFGLAIPFLAAALGISWVMVILQRFPRTTRIVEIVMGTIMIISGFLLVFDSFSLINSLIPGFRPIY